MNIPELPAGFTPAYLTEILREDGILSASGAVTDVGYEMVGDGTGMSSELARLRLTYEGDRGLAPDTVVSKFLPNNETNRASALAFHLPEREVRYCAELAPLTAAVTPKTFCCHFDGEAFLIVMEDLADYKVGSQVEGATLRQTELAMDELAKLHSVFWNKVADLDWVPGIANSYHAEALGGGAVIGWPSMEERFEVSDYVCRHRDRFLPVIAALQAERMRAPMTLVHGDFRMENVFYGHGPGQHEIIVFDWQGPLKARGMFDVSLFLGQSTKTEVRRDHEYALLERYLEGLKSGGVNDVGWDFIWEDYQRCMLYNWVYTSVVAGTLDVSSDVARAWMTKMIERHAAASEDLDVFRFLPDYE
ncbi:MAG: phosphotransferase [Pseudomonadales bacterium]|nr:phosphotransferase [Pseudomonadales bacterium]MBO6703734.1 phosphotransferase [Pseudomonadales bacterium]MBO7004209.1 phosphotransferase [Pseudomonadales bacterium]